MPDHVRGRRAGRLCYGLGVWPAIALITLLCACRTDPLAGVLGAEAGRPFRVWVFTASTLAGPWARPSEPLASGLSSRGSHAEPDGGLALTCCPMGGEPVLLAELLPRRRFDEARRLLSILLEAPAVVSDPQALQDLAGLLGRCAPAERLIEQADDPRMRWFARKRSDEVERQVRRVVASRQILAVPAIAS